MIVRLVILPFVVFGYGIRYYRTRMLSLAMIMRRAWISGRFDFLYTQVSTLFQGMIDCLIEPVMWLVGWYVMGSFGWERPLFLVFVILASLSARGALQLRGGVQGNRDEGDYTFNIFIETVLLLGDVFLIVFKELSSYDGWFLWVHLGIRSCFVFLTLVNIIVLISDMRQQGLFPFFDAIMTCGRKYRQRHKMSPLP
ncbi:MAG: hypothetical protein NZL83_04300 [Candidatus Absconditabacterales bacterium]|nr:hypothetical protein [Candidatus Absconditabacterales bacterium]